MSYLDVAGEMLHDGDEDLAFAFSEVDGATAGTVAFVVGHCDVDSCLVADVLE